MSDSRTNITNEIKSINDITVNKNLPIVTSTDIHLHKKKKIIRIDYRNDFKQYLLSQLTPYSTNHAIEYGLIRPLTKNIIEITLNNHHEKLIRIKIATIEKEYCNFGDICIILTMTTNNDELHYLVRDELALTIEKLLRTISDKLPENCTDLRASKSERQQSLMIDSQFWGSDDGWIKNQEHEQMYDTFIDPVTVEGFRNILKNKNTENIHSEERISPLLIMDVGAGTGRLAVKLINEAKTKNIPLHYIFIEPDKIQCQMAEKRLASLREEIKFRITLYQYTLSQFFQHPDYVTQFQGKADVVISSGGPINIQVSSHNNAVENMAILRDMLNPDGQIIATGKTRLTLKKKEIEKTGLTLFSSCAKHPAFKDFSFSHQRYVMGKTRT